MHLVLWGRPEASSCDRWPIAELVQSLDVVGFPDCQISERGQGCTDGAEDVRLFRADLRRLAASSTGTVDPGQCRWGQGDDRPGWQQQATQARRGDLQGLRAATIIMAMVKGRRRALQPEREELSYAVL